jgi:transcriptional regulator with XRE-family HTH domain
MDMRKLVGRNFARLRRAKGLTQEQVEVRSGFSQQYISKLECGERNPTIITLYEIAQAINVNCVDLVAPEN